MPTPNVYLYWEGQQSGPFELAAVEDMVSLGSIPKTALAFMEGTNEWVSLESLLQELTTGSTTPHSADSKPPDTSKPASVSEPSFFAALPGAFTYPLTKSVILIGGAVFFALLSLVGSFMGMASFGLGILTFGYLCASVQNIIVSSAQGDTEMPSWPDFSDFHQDIIVPAINIGFTIFLCLAPGAALTWIEGFRQPSDGTQSRQYIVWVLYGAGGFYLPMALLAVSMADSLSGLNPFVVVPSIIKVFPEYLATCLGLAFLIALNAAIGTYLSRLIPIPVVAEAPAGALWLYLLAVKCRVLGLLYYTNRHKLGWFR